MNLRQHGETRVCIICLQAQQSHNLKSQVECLQEQVSGLVTKAPTPTAPMPVQAGQKEWEARLKIVEEQLKTAQQLPTSCRKRNKDMNTSSGNETGIVRSMASEVGSSSDSEGVKKHQVCL